MLQKSTEKTKRIVEKISIETQREYRSNVPENIRKHLSKKQSILLGYFICFSGSDFYKKNGYCFATNEDLCRMFGISNTTVANAKSALSSMKLLKCKQGARGLATQYTVTLDKFKPLDTPKKSTKKTTNSTPKTVEVNSIEKLNDKLNDILNEIAAINLKINEMHNTIVSLKNTKLYGIEKLNDDTVDIDTDIDIKRKENNNTNNKNNGYMRYDISGKQKEKKENKEKSSRHNAHVGSSAVEVKGVANADFEVKGGTPLTEKPLNTSLEVGKIPFTNNSIESTSSGSDRNDTNDNSVDSSVRASMSNINQGVTDNSLSNGDFSLSEVGSKVDNQMDYYQTFQQLRKTAHWARTLADFMPTYNNFIALWNAYSTENPAQTPIAKQYNDAAYTYMQNRLNELQTVHNSTFNGNASLASFEVPTIAPNRSDDRKYYPTDKTPLKRKNDSSYEKRSFKPTKKPANPYEMMDMFEVDGAIDRNLNLMQVCKELTIINQHIRETRSLNDGNSLVRQTKRYYTYALSKADKTNPNDMKWLDTMDCSLWNIHNNYCKLIDNRSKQQSYHQR